MVDERAHAQSAAVSDLARPVSMSLPAVMQQLAVLEGLGSWFQKIGRVRRAGSKPRD